MSAMDDTNLANANEKAKRREMQNFHDIDNSYVTCNDADKRRALVFLQRLMEVHTNKSRFTEYK